MPLNLGGLNAAISSMTDTITLTLRQAGCPYCGAEPSVDPIFRRQYSKTLTAVFNVQNFHGQVDCCDICGVYFVNPRYDENEFADIYTRLSLKQGTFVKRLASWPSEVAIKYWNDASLWRRILSRLIGGALEPLAMMPVPPESFSSGRVLDVGCGDGFHLRCYEKIGCDIAGTEIHPGYEALLSAPPKPIRNWIKSFTSINWLTETGFGVFDLIIFQSVFYRLSDPAEALRLSWELLKPGGTILRIEPFCPDDESVDFMTRFNFPQGYAMIRDVEKYVSVLEQYCPDATIRWRFFYGRSRKHMTGQELNLITGGIDVIRRLFAQFTRQQPWFIRLEITKPHE